MTAERTGPAAFVDAALERFERPLLQYAVRMLRDPEAARDVVQDTFLRLCREDPDRLRETLAPWLFTVCRRLVLDELRRNGRMVTTAGEILDDRPGAPSDPAGRAAAREDAERAITALAALPSNQREVVELKIRHGLSYREIAAVTGLTTGNVGFLLHTALKTLRRRLAAGDREAAGGAR